MMASYATTHQRPRTHGSTLAQDRFIPGVWNVFDPYNPQHQQQQQQQQQMTMKQQQQLLRQQQHHQQTQHNMGEWTPTGVTAVKKPPPPVQAAQHGPFGHVNWSPKNQDALQKWCDRNGPVDRPRTYDRYYEKTPSNFHSTPSLTHSQSMSRSHPRLMMTQCEVDAGKTQSQDSAVGSSDADTANGQVVGPSQRKVKRSKRKRGELQYSRTITERDVRHLERQLSMKKTIRKKIMRDLQQAFVGDRNRLETLEMPPTPKNKPKSAASHLDLASALHFGEGARKRAFSAGEQKFLDLLRDGPTSGSEDSGHGGSPSTGSRHKFRSVRERPTHERGRVIVYDSSTEDNEVHQQQSQMSQFGGPLQQPPPQMFHHPMQQQQLQHFQYQQQLPQEDEIVVEVEQLAIDDSKQKKPKKGFWQFFKKNKQ